jgi:hypothetical protein
MAPQRPRRGFIHGRVLYIQLAVDIFIRVFEASQKIDVALDSCNSGRVLSLEGSSLVLFMDGSTKLARNF